MRNGGGRERLVVVTLSVMLLVAPVARAQSSQGSAASKAGNASGAIRKANAAVREGRYEDAEGLFKQALAAAPASATAACGLGWTYIKMRRYVEAAATAAGVLRTAPDDARAISVTAFALMRSGLLREAAAEFLKAANKDPGEPLAIAGIAEILLYTGNFAESLRFAERAVRLAGDEPDFLFLLGQVAARQEQFEEAADAYTLFLRAAPKIDGERRARIKALIDVCRALAGTKLYLKSGPDSIVLPIDFSAGYLPLVSVTVNGKGPFRFAIDTGSGYMVISDKLASTLKIRPLAHGGSSQGVGGEGRFPLVYGLIRTLGLGALSIDNVPTYIRRFHQEPADAIDGYVGLSILSRFQSTVDYGNRRFELRPLASPTAESGPEDVVLSYQVTGGGMLSVPTDVDTGALLNFVVDTGASTSVVSADVFQRYDLGAKLRAGATARVVGAAGVTEGVSAVVFDHLSVPGLETGRALRHESVRALVLDLSAINETAGFQIAGIIGGNVLRAYRLELDASRGRLVLRPNREPPSNDRPR